MRLIQTAALCATIALPSVAHAQSKKIDGASLPGMCAAAVEFVAGARSSAGAAQPVELQTLQHTRNLYLAAPGFPPGEVEGYANAWSQRMAQNMAEAADETARGKVAQRIGKVALECQNRMVQKVQAEQRQGGVIQTTPQPLPAQPLAVQPLQSQPVPRPRPAQPLETQPVIIQ